MLDQSKNDRLEDHRHDMRIRRLKYHAMTKNVRPSSFSTLTRTGKYIPAGQWKNIPVGNR